MRSFLITALLFIPFFTEAQVFKTLTPLNSEARETNLSVTPNGRYLFFMSQRGGQSWSVLRDSSSEKGAFYDGDIWYSVKVDGEWQPAECLSEQINTYDGEDEPNVTVDGQAVYFQSWRDDWQTTGGPYYRAELDGVVWKNPVGLGDEINRFFRELSIRTDRTLVKELRERDLYDDYLTILRENKDNDNWQDELKKVGIDMDDYRLATDGMAVSPDEKTFIVSAYHPEKKEFDLFISRQNKDGRWTYPKPLDINTPSDEISVFIAGDNKTLYFASDQEGGYGGFDIYKTTLTGGTSCGAVENLGPPYNRDKDEYGFIVNANEGIGFMIVDGDIVEVNLNEKAKPQETIVINGRVIDDEGNPLATSVVLINTLSGDTLDTGNTNTYSGEYSFSYAREEGTYNQIITTPEGIRVEEPFEVNAETDNTLEFLIIISEPKEGNAKIINSLIKEKLQKGEIFRVDKLYFEADKAVIMEESFPVLDQVSRILTSRREIVVEVGGHTNGLPPHDYCDKLSTERAKTIYDYLVAKGVPETRLAYKGYGKRRPIESNKTLQGRKVNQRVEIKILEVKD